MSDNVTRVPVHLSVYRESVTFTLAVYTFLYTKDLALDTTTTARVGPLSGCRHQWYETLLLNIQHVIMINIF